MFHFQPGEKVWQRVKGWAQGSKLQPRAIGPFVVKRVKGLLGQRVVIVQCPQPGQKRKRGELTVHASQLAPYVGTYEAPELVYDEGDGAEGVNEGGDRLGEADAPRGRTVVVVDPGGGAAEPGGAALRPQKRAAR